MALAVLVIIIGAIVIKNKSTKPSEKKIITIANNKGLSTALVVVASKKGFFDKYGLDVRLSPVQTGDESLKAVVGKSADIAISAVPPFAFFAIDNQQMKIFAMVGEGNDNQVVARKDRGINNPADLKGKKIGYAKTTSSEIGLQKLLEANGLTEEDVQLVNLKPLAMPTALVAGEIDAYSMFEPHIINGAKMLGDNAITFTEPYTWQVSLIADESYIKQNKDALEKVVKALMDAQNFIAENKDESIAITADYVSIPAETLNAIWSKYDFKVDLKDNLIDSIKYHLIWANDQRETKADKLPDAEPLIDRSIFDYAKNH